MPGSQIFAGRPPLSMPAFSLWKLYRIERDPASFREVLRHPLEDSTVQVCENVTNCILLTITRQARLGCARGHMCWLAVSFAVILPSPPRLSQKVPFFSCDASDAGWCACVHRPLSAPASSDSVGPAGHSAPGSWQVCCCTRNGHIPAVLMLHWWSAICWGACTPALPRHCGLCILCSSCCERR